MKIVLSIKSIGSTLENKAIMTWKPCWILTQIGKSRIWSIYIIKFNINKNIIFYINLLNLNIKYHKIVYTPNNIIFRRFNSRERFYCNYFIIQWSLYLQGTYLLNPTQKKSPITFVIHSDEWWRIHCLSCFKIKYFMSLIL